MFDQLADLRFAFGRVQGFSPALHDVGNTVEFGRHPAQPQRMQRFDFTGGRLRVE